MSTTDDILDALGHADAIYKFDDGRALRVRVEIDQDTDINDDEFYGKIGAGTRDRDTGYAVRPDDFDGNAEKLWLSSDFVWWQPPPDVPRTSEHFAAFRSQVRSLAEYGYCGVIVELLDGEDAYHRPIVREVASLWGIDSLDNGYLREVVGDLLSELHYEEEK